MKQLDENLFASLGFLARLAGGYATLINLETGNKKTVNAEGKEIKNYSLDNYEGLAEAKESRHPMMVEASNGEGITTAFIPIENYLLVINNVDTVKNKASLKSTFQEALPFIARVVGGEAVLFDQQGIRFLSYRPDGRESDKGMGEFTYLGHQAMELRRPVIGPSLLEEGAMAVRIPINEEFGVGFNNVLAVKQKKILVASGNSGNTKYTFDDIVGSSLIMQQCIQQARQVAVTNSTVLMFGETGTGKEVFAQSIHNASQRASGPFIAINCGAFPATLVESQLFGYEEGAFTGAKKGGQKGVFEQANEGTLFLDEISEMELELQSRLLRVLQEREVTRLGGKKSIPISVRIIASTNRNLWGLVSSGKFRQDLFYRLNVIDLNIPPLRERVGDIQLLVRHFIKQFRNNFGTFILDISDEALQLLKNYSWPGNVRELQNCVERTLSLATGVTVQPQDLPAIIRNYSGRKQAAIETVSNNIPRIDSSGAGSTGTLELPGLKDTAQAAERDTIIKTLAETGHNRRLAAKKLGISTTTLWRKMKRLDLIADPSEQN